MKITLEHIRNLHADLLQEERIMKSRLSVRNIRSLLEKKLCKYEIDVKGIFMFAALWPTINPHYLELGTCWVRKEKRGKHLFSAFLDQVLRCANKGTTIFLITKSGKVVHEAVKRNWEEVKDWQDSIQWQTVCNPKAGSKAEAKRSFSEDCRLFYTILS